MVTLPIRSIVYILDANQWIVVSKMFLSHIITLIIVNFLSAKQFNCESSRDSNTSTHNLINFLKSIDTISKFINIKQKETIQKLCKMKTVSSLRWKRKFSNTMKFFLFFSFFREKDQLCEFYGYKSERFTVTTTDGYILTIFRCYGQITHRQPVLLVHGLIESSDIWAMNPGNKSLGIEKNTLSLLFSLSLS